MLQFNPLSALFFVGLLSVSCVKRNYNSSTVSKTGNIEAAERDPATGLYNVICKDGTSEKAVSKERLDAGDCCKAKSDTAKTALDPMAYNAFLLWRDADKKTDGSKTAPIFELPSGYDVRSGEIEPDEVFYVSRDAYWKDVHSQVWIGEETEGAKVDKDILSYTAKDGRQLKLKFSSLSEKPMSHFEAVQYCAAQTPKMRLPTIRELFDFCVKGFEREKFGRYLKSRCGPDQLWSASIFSGYRDHVWSFNGRSNTIFNYNRSIEHFVRCTGQ